MTFGAKSGPKGSPKAPQKGSKNHQKSMPWPCLGHLGAQEPTRDGFWTDLGSIWGRFGVDFEAIWGRFGGLT